MHLLIYTVAAVAVFVLEYGCTVFVTTHYHA